MWNKDGVIWYSEEEYKEQNKICAMLNSANIELREEVKDLEELAQFKEQRIRELLENYNTLENTYNACEKEYQTLQEKLKDYEQKYEFAKNQNNALFLQYKKALAELKKLKEVQNA